MKFIFNVVEFFIFFRKVVSTYSEIAKMEPKKSNSEHRYFPKNNYYTRKYRNKIYENNFARIKEEGWSLFKGRTFEFKNIKTKTNESSKYNFKYTCSCEFFHLFFDKVHNNNFSYDKCDTSETFNDIIKHTRYTSNFESQITVSNNEKSLIRDYPIKICSHEEQRILKDPNFLKIILEFIENKYLELCQIQIQKYNTIPFAIKEEENCSLYRKKIINDIVEILISLPFFYLDDLLLFVFNIQYFSSNFTNIFKFHENIEKVTKNLFEDLKGSRNPHELESINVSWNFWNERIRPQLKNLTIGDVFEVIIDIPELEHKKIQDCKNFYFKTFFEFYLFLYDNYFCIEGKDDLK